MDEVLGIALRTYFHSDIYFPQGTKPFGWNLTFSLTQTNEHISLQAKQQSPWVIFFIISQHDGDSCISPLTFCIVPVLYSCGTRTLFRFCCSEFDSRSRTRWRSYWSLWSYFQTYLTTTKDNRMCRFWWNPLKESNKSNYLTNRDLYSQWLSLLFSHAPMIIERQCQTPMNKFAESLGLCLH